MVLVATVYCRVLKYSLQATWYWIITITCHQHFDNVHATVWLLLTSMCWFNAILTSQIHYYITYMVLFYYDKPLHNVHSSVLMHSNNIVWTNHPWEIHTISNKVVQVESITRPKVEWRTPHGPPSWKLCGSFKGGWFLLLPAIWVKSHSKSWGISQGNSFNYLWEIHTSSHPLPPAKKATSRGIISALFFKIHGANSNLSPAIKLLL